MRSARGASTTAYSPFDIVCQRSGNAVGILSALVQNAHMDRKMFLSLVAFAGLALLLYLLHAILTPFLVALGWAGVIAIATFPLYERLLRKLGNREGWAAGIMVLGVALIVIVPATILAFLLAQESARLYGSLSQAAGGGKMIDLAHLERHTLFGSSIAKVTRWFGRLGLDPGADLASAAKKVVAAAANYAASAVKDFFLFLVDLFLILFALFFLYRDGRRIQEFFWRALPVQEEKKRVLEDILVRILPSVLTAILVTAVAQGILGGIGFWISGLPSPIFFGALTGVASLVPVVGTMLIWFPGGVYLLFQGDTTWKRRLLAWGALVVGSADHFLRPALSGKQSGLPLPLIMLGSLGGLAAFGLIGLVLGPVILGVSLALLEMQKPG